jgi:WD40 repeat protein
MMPVLRVFALATLVLGLARPVHSADDPPEFTRDIQPLLKAHCLACHTHGQVKGELRLDTIELILKGGESGPGIVKGDAEKSLLYQVVAGKNELVMPPPKNKVGATPLSPQEVDLLKRWIGGGAKVTAAPLVLSTEPPQWRPLPPGLNAIHAVAVSPDGQTAACARANQIFVYTLGGGGALSARLVDPALKEGSIADRDFVQSLAFSPDGLELATGGYRSIRIWKKQASAPLFTLDLGAPPQVLVTSPDSKLVASGGADGTITLWDPASGQKTKTLTGHTAAVESLAFSADGTRLLSGSADKTFRLWTLSGGAPLQADLGQEVTAVAFAGDQKRIAAAAPDFLIRVYPVPAEGAPWEKPREMKGHSGRITALRAVGSGRQILSASEDGSLRLWNTETGKEEKKMDHGAPVTDLAVSADGKRWVSAGGTAAKVWKSGGELQSTIKGDRRAADLQSTSELGVAFQKEEIAYFKNVSQENEKTLAAERESVKKAEDRLATLTKEAGPKEEAARKAAESKPDVERDQKEVAAALAKAAAARPAAEAALPAAKTSAKAAAEKAAQAKKALEKAETASAAAQKAVDDLKPDAPPDEASKLRETAAAARKSRDAAAEAHAAATKSAGDLEAASQAAQEVLASREKTEKDLAQRQKDLDPRLKAAEKAISEGQQATQSLSAAEQNHERLLQVERRGEEALSSSKSSLAAAEARLKEAEEALGAARKAVSDSEHPVRRVSLSLDARTVATSGDDGLVRMWNAETGKGGQDLGPLEGLPDSISFLASDRFLSARGERAWIWGLAAPWTLVRTIGDGGIRSPILDRVLALSYSPDGRMLVSAGGIPARTGEIKIWDPSKGTLLRELRDAHSDTVFALAFTRDGRRLASGGADKLIKIWDPETGAFIRLFEGHTQHVLGLAWKWNGRILLSAGADKVAKIWDLVSGEQLKTIEGYRKEVTGISWLAASNEFLLASGDGQLCTHREDGNRTRNFQFGKAYIESSSVTPEGRLIVAGGSDSVFRVFEPGKEKLLLGFDPP